MFKTIICIIAIISLPMGSFADGVIKLKFAKYKYTEDAGGASANSYNMLGPVHAYVVKIYPAKIMQNVKSGIIGNIIPQCIYLGGEMFVNNAAQLKPNNVKKLIAAWFKSNKGPLSVYFVNPSMNHTYEYPIPDGKYYLQYFLQFKKTQLNGLKSSSGIAGPYYPRGEYGQWQSWGESVVNINNNKVDVLFEPQDVNTGGDNIARYTKFFTYLLKTGKID